MRTADVVLYDRLISSDVLEYVSEDALMIYVGKERGMHTRSQEEIHALLYRFWSKGARVVRLKGGDPYVFGRGGEELDYLQRRGVEVRCVPGITAASGVAAALGIPLTHRGIADNVQFVTGHLRGEVGSQETTEAIASVASKVACENTTVVVYMGLSSLPALADAVVACGLDPDTPAAAVERGTTADQRTLFASIASLPDAVLEAGLQSPTLIIVGGVVALAPQWQDNACEIQAVWQGKEEGKEGKEGKEAPSPRQQAQVEFWIRETTAHEGRGAMGQAETRPQ